jgi:predicted RNase H-like HicB family nuclease
MTDVIAVTVEATPKRTFATAIDWPGLSRSGKTEELALAALADAVGRYAEVAGEAGEPFPPGVFAVVERTTGGASTDFGVPSLITGYDRRSVSAPEAARLARFMEAAWTVFGRVAEAAPAVLRTGPRGGGRDRDRIVRHVDEADHAYAQVMGIKVAAPDRADPATVEAMRTAMLEAIRRPSDGSPIAGRKWPPRYAAHRIAWHALDHAWEIEDRTEPG